MSISSFFSMRAVTGLTTVWRVVYLMFVQKPIHNSFNCAVTNHMSFTEWFVKLIPCHSIPFCLQVIRY